MNLYLIYSDCCYHYKYNMNPELKASFNRISVAASIINFNITNLESSIGSSIVSDNFIQEIKKIEKDLVTHCTYLNTKNRKMYNIPSNNIPSNNIPSNNIEKEVRIENEDNSFKSDVIDLSDTTSIKAEVLE